MLIHPQFDPVAIHLGPLAIRWYGLMYLAGFIMFLWFGRLRIRQPHMTQTAGPRATSTTCCSSACWA